jgi:hypothetical protein
MPIRDNDMYQLTERPHAFSSQHLVNTRHRLQWRRLRALDEAMQRWFCRLDDVTLKRALGRRALGEEGGGTDDCTA